MQRTTKKHFPFWQTPFFIKLFHWEYWPSFIVYAPAAFYWLYFAIKSRKLFYFTPVNPIIETGGVFGESKMNILNRIPKNLLPKTLFIEKAHQEVKHILSLVEKAGIAFPFIAKPDIGERGFLVEIIKDESALSAYLKNINAPFLIQELIEYPIELSVLHYRMPNEKKGNITSVCIKKTLTVVGDGKATIEMLMREKSRARLQLARFQGQYPELLEKIPAIGEEIVLEPIGNHSRGTTFLNGNHLIDTQLESVFDEISFQMEDIYYGRFDLKCQSIELLKEGKGMKILEFNGVAGEPAHIYDPDYPVWKAYRDIYQHFKTVYLIGKAQMKNGIKAMSLSEMIRSYQNYRNYLKTAHNLFH